MIHNNAEYAKLASSPLWVEILSNVISFVPSSKINISTYLNSKLKNHPPKLSLFSAHDGTLHMLLASLGKEVFDGKDWAPFASYVVIELHDILNTGVEVGKIFPSGKAFRMIYNGKVLTSKVQGCPEDILGLCDVSVLVKVLGTIATSERSCETIFNQNDDDNHDLSNTLHHTRHNIMMAVIISLVSGCLGSCLTLLYVNKRLGCNKRAPRYEAFSKNDIDIAAHNEIPDIS